MSEVPNRTEPTGDKLLLSGLRELLWKVYELEETVRQGGGPGQQELLEQRLKAMMNLVQDTSQNTHAFADLHVPIGLLKHLDSGGLPDYFTSETFKASLADNQASKGKVDAVACLREQLLEQLSQTLVEETQEYRSLLDHQGIKTSTQDQ